MTARSSLYLGTVMHRRLKPRAHHLRYRVFWVLLDLDDIGALAKRLRLFSRDRFNLFSFHRGDHGDGSREPLRAQVERHLAAAGLDLQGGAIRLLCMPRILGYGFNPLSVYYCHRRSGELAAMLYQVHNTFGERHSYLVAVDPPADGAVRHACAKGFYVSPFIGMDLVYEFRAVAPSDRISLAIRAADPQGPLLVAALTGRRAELTDAALLRVFFTYPVLTLKVIAAIHFEALRLWLKGLRLRPRPAPPAAPVTIVDSQR